LSQFDKAKQSASQFAPRGGGRNAALQELPYREAGDITSLLQKVRPEAAKELTAISEFLSQLGLSEEQLASYNYATVLAANLEKSAQRQQMLSTIGKAIGAVLGGPIGAGIAGAVFPGSKDSG